MFSHLIFKLSWHLQLAAGLALLALSFLIQQQVLAGYVATPYLAGAAAGLLVLGKALSLTFYRQLRLRVITTYPFSTRLLLALFRVTLLSLSLVFSLSFFLETFERPSAEALRRADLAGLEQRHENKLQRLREEQAQERREALAALDAHYQPLLDGLGARFLPAIRELERRLNDAPADSARAQALTERLRAEREQHRRELGELQAERRTVLLQQQVALDKRRDQALKTLLREYQSERDRLARADYANDLRRRQTFLDRLLALASTVQPLSVSRQTLLFWFALLASLLLELALIVVLEHIALVYFPLFQAEHERRLKLHRRRIEAEGELQLARIDEKLLQRQVHAERGQIERRMRRAVAEAGDKLAG